VHRLSQRGNRKVNHALHMVAVTAIPALRDGIYFERKVSEGKTKKEALRYRSGRRHRHISLKAVQVLPAAH
jgi:hypothetical protein